jgi:NAD(P)-dependent dehydrogenase (short-subunit alcohol dehydrogenase family)
MDGNRTEQTDFRGEGSENPGCKGVGPDRGCDCGTSGIGRATCIAFALRGAEVVIAGRRQKEGMGTLRLVQDNGSDGIFIETDVAQEADLRRLIEETIERYGRLDCAFNNAGTEGRFAPMEELDVADFDRTIAVNLRGTWLAMKYEIAAMKKLAIQGSIVNTSSWLVKGATIGSSVYSASKGGIDAMSRAAAMEVAELGIRVNSIQPGYIVTDMFRRFFDPEDRVKGWPFLYATPARRYGRAEEIAALAVWLCSAEATYITGQSIAVDGGLTVPGNRPEMTA